MFNDSVNVYIFTKDNPSVLGSLLADLRRTRDGVRLEAPLTIIDDSVDVSSRDHVSHLAGAYGDLNVDIVRLEEQQSMRTSRSDAMWLRRALGTAGYDVGTCRNIAFAHVLSSATKLARPTLFLDADIRLEAAEIEGRRFVVDGATVLSEMLRSVARDPLLIVGAPMIGRADISLLEHLEYGICEASDLQKVTFSSGYYLSPAVLAGRNAPGFGQPLGMSGGALCVSGQALREAPMMNLYNEDILWLSYLRERGFRLMPTAEPLIHADATPVRIDRAIVRQNAFGEAMWGAVERCGWRANNEQQLRKAWRAAVDSVSEQLRVIARRLSDTRMLAGGSVRIDVMDLVALLRCEAEWIEAMPATECSEVLESFRTDVASWRVLWAPN